MLKFGGLRIWTRANHMKCATVGCTSTQHSLTTMHGDDSKL